MKPMYWKSWPRNLLMYCSLASVSCVSGGYSLHQFGDVLGLVLYCTWLYTLGVGYFISGYQCFFCPQLYTYTHVIDYQTTMISVRNKLKTHLFVLAFSTPTPLPL